jgi:hypothetical protein
MKQFISYSADINIVNDPKWQDNWEERYHSLNEEDAILVATFWYNIKKKRMQKLIDHSSRNFTFIKTRKIVMYKHFHDKPIEYISADKQLHDHVKTLLREI